MRTNQNFEIDRPTTLGFSFFIYVFFRFSFFSSSFLFAAVFGLLPGFFRESINEARTTYHGQAKGGKGKFSSEFFTKIWKGFQAPSM